MTALTYAAYCYTAEVGAFVSICGLFSYWDEKLIRLTRRLKQRLKLRYTKWHLKRLTRTLTRQRQRQWPRQ